jgi:hypothetical protein
MNQIKVLGFCLAFVSLGLWAFLAPKDQDLFPTMAFFALIGAPFFMLFFKKRM